MTGLEIRPAGPEDLEGILSLYGRPEIDGDEVLDRAEAERVLERIAGYPNYRYYVAVDGGRVVGVFGLLIMDNLRHRGAPSGVIEDVAVHPEWQRRGIGRRMMAEALEICRRAGCYKAALSSNLRSGGAHAFYEKLGFEKHGYSFRVRPG